MAVKTLKSKRIILLFLLAFIATAFVLFFYVIPRYEDAKRNSVYSSTPVNNATVNRLHQSLFIADLHADSLLWSRSLSSRHNYGHVDIPRMQSGNMALQVFSVVTKTPRNLNYYSNDDKTDNITLLAVAQRWPARTWKSLLQRAIYQSEKLREVVDHDQFILIHSEKDLEQLISLRKKGKPVMGGLLSLEGAHALEGELGNVDVLFEQGYRIIGFTHFFDNELGGSAHGLNKGGITNFGLKVLKRMETLGMIVDVSHASPKLIDDIFKHSTQAIIATHTGVKGVCNNSPRNLTDSQIRQIAQSGGVVGIGFWPSAVCTNDISGIIQSIQYVTNLVGVDYVALGSDFDGNVQTPFDVSDISLITQGLINAGYSEKSIRKIMGGNVLRVFKKTLPD